MDYIDQHLGSRIGIKGNKRSCTYELYHNDYTPHLRQKYIVDYLYSCETAVVAGIYYLCHKQN